MEARITLTFRVKTILELTRTYSGLHSALEGNPLANAAPDQQATLGTIVRHLLQLHAKLAATQDAETHEATWQEGFEYCHEQETAALRQRDTLGYELWFHAHAQLRDLAFEDPAFDEEVPRD